MASQSHSNVPPALVRYSIDHPRTIITIALILTVIFAAGMFRVRIDTDPENMLSEEEAVRVFHNNMKKVFDLHDMVVLGVVNENHPDGVFNPDSLKKIYELTEFSKSLQWTDDAKEGRTIGVVTGDIMSPSTVDNIEQAGPGTVRFEWLMKEPPATREEALAIRDNARDNPLLYGTLLSEDGRALAIYLPLTSKDLSYRVYTELKKKIAGFKGDEQYHITGLPVAEDTFGVEMFVQMGVSAPLAMLIIFILMFVFFRKIVLILSPLIIAMISVIWTMGLLIILGYPVHIMSSMIPIFIMPISVLDSVHIKSQFFDRYQSMKDQKKTLYLVMSDLFTPMLYTSLTTVAGFLSLALTPIPPVQVFGVFVAFGVAAAWILTITFVPAFTMLIRKSSLENFGMKPESEGENTMADRFLHTLGRFAYRFSPMILVLTAVAALISLYGISLIQVNDNPVKWFSRKHPIRIADKVLNEHFGGTYMGYLVLQSSQSPRERVVEAAAVLASLEKDVMDEYGDKGIALLKEAITILNSRQNIENLNDLKHVIVEDFSSRRQMAETSGDYDTADVWSLMETALVPIFDPFKNPKVLEHMALLQESLLKTNVVGKSNSVTDLVKKVHKELLEGKEEEFRIPDTAQAVGQCLLSFQNSHRPNDLWRLVTPDYETANIWVQLTSGDNKDMSRVVAAVDEYMKANPGPVQMKHEWFGLTYINVIWQEKMVKGMLESFLGSFLIVWLMMLILYRSVWWGTIAMIPMTVTVGVIYGFIGFIGKDYDMPVAVLSALTLGLAVDFGIHFLSRARMSVEQSRTGEWEEVRGEMFGEPARAVTRNIIVIAVGFLPLVAAPLIPYKTVGIFFSAILGLSGVATLLIMPSLVQVLRRQLFIRRDAVLSASCNCGLCIATSAAAVVLIALNLYQYFSIGISLLTKISLILIPILALSCGIMSRRSACRVNNTRNI